MTEPSIPPNITSGLTTYRFHAIFLLLLIISAFPNPVYADPGTTDIKTRQSDNDPTRSAIGFYQRFISPADGDRCPMHPSCSRYAQQAIQREGLIVGWVLACDRLLRCGRDETRLSRRVHVNGQRLVYDPLDANTFWWKKR